MAANPFGRAKSGFPDDEGQDRSGADWPRATICNFRYGILAHEGDAESGRVAELYQRL